MTDFEKQLSDVALLEKLVENTLIDLESSIPSLIDNAVKTQKEYIACLRSELLEKLSLLESLDPIDDEKQLSIIIDCPVTKVQEIESENCTEAISLIYPSVVDEYTFRDAYMSRIVNWQRTIELCEQILTKFPTNMMTKALKAEAYLNLFDTRSQKLFQEIIAQKPYTAEDECAIGDALYMTSKQNDAIAYYLRSAQHQCKYAQHKLAACYYSGVGVEKSKELALKWWKRSADQGLPIAQYSLAYITPDKAEQFRLYKAAAEEGHQKSQHKLGMCYKNGIGCDKNLEKGNFWIDKALSRGDEN